MPRCLPQTLSLTRAGYTVECVWERKAVKNYNLRVRRDGSVHLSTPTHITKAMAERFLLKKWDFVKGAKERIAARALPMALTLSEGEQIPIFGVPHTVCLQAAARICAYCTDGVLYLLLPHPEDASARVRAFWRFATEEVFRVMRALTDEAAPHFLAPGAPQPEITLRRMKSRWGSCYYTRNRINYNTNLIFAPLECARYVACHELSHFCHPDHSAAFYACLARVMPQHREWRRILHSTKLPQIGTE